MRTRSSLSARTLILLSLMAAIPACSKPKPTANPEDASASGQASAAAPAVDSAKSGGLVNVANADLAKGRFNAAAKRAQEALDANPENPDAWSVLGAARWRAGNLEGATEAYEKAIGINNKLFGAVVGYAQVLQAMGRHEDAIAALDALIAGESEGFKEGPCQENNICDAGSCVNGTCKPPMQVAPRFLKLGSQYLLLDVDGGLKSADDIFVGVGAQPYETDFARAYASFLRPLAGKGPLVQIEGEQGNAKLGMDYQLGMRYTELSVGGKKQMVVLNDVGNETQIDAGLVAELGLKSLGEVTPYGAEAPQKLVMIPEIKIGDVTIKNIPALVTSLEQYGASIGSLPGVLLGQQVLSRFGAMRYDMPANELTVYKSNPGAPAGATEVPMLMLNMLAARLPAVQMRLDGSDKTFWSLLGGTYQSGVALSQKEYLRAGHRPEDLENPEVPEQGLKVVLVDEVSLGGLTERGVGGLVFLNTPPDATLNSVLVTTGFNLDGYVNAALFARWAITVDYKNAKLYLESPALVAAQDGGAKSKKKK